MSNVVLETKNLSKAFKGITATDKATQVIKNLNFQVLAGETVAIVGSGWEGTYSLEDSLAAGALTTRLQELSQAVTLANDEATAATALWQQWRHDPEACLRTASHGQRLIRLGDHDDDFRCCAGLDQLSVVPTQQSPGVLQAI